MINFRGREDFTVPPEAGSNMQKRFSETIWTYCSRAFWLPGTCKSDRLLS